MPLPDALIHQLTLHATADDTADALRVLHVAEATVSRAVEKAAASIGGEVLVLRRVELDFAVDLDGRHPIDASQMERALRTALVRVIQRAQSAGSTGPVVTEHAAWFPSEAAAIADLLAAHAEGRAPLWPYSALTLWGATAAELFRTCLARGRVLLGDALAAAIRRLDARALLELMTDEIVEAILAVYTEGASDRTIAASALPADLRAAIAREVETLSFASPGQQDLVTLARLFALWPPARDARIPLVELRLIATSAAESRDATPGEVLAELLKGTGAEELVGRLPADAVAALLTLLRGSRDGREASLAALWARLENAGIATAKLREAVEGTLVKRLVSAAGGLVAWSALFAAEGLSAEIDEAYPAPRARRAVRWAIGRALEDARIGGVDPLLLLWAGEDLDTLVDPGPALATADPEPLHTRALRVATGRGLLSGPLEAARFGDGVTLTGEDGFCVDAVLGDDVDRAIPELVRRFSRRVGKPPAGVRVASRMTSEGVDALAELDVPPLLEPWRIAVRAFASMARTALVERWRTQVRDLRRWPAIVESGRGVAVEILRSDASRVAGGGWLRESVSIGDRSVIVRAK